MISIQLPPTKTKEEVQKISMEYTYLLLLAVFLQPSSSITETIKTETIFKGEWKFFGETFTHIEMALINLS